MRVGSQNELFGSSLFHQILISSRMNNTSPPERRGGEEEGAKRRRENPIHTNLGFGIILGLILPPHDRPSLIRVYKIANVVADDAGRAGVDKRLDTSLPGSFDDRLGTLDIDLVE